MRNIRDRINRDTHLEVRLVLSGKTIVDIGSGAPKLFLDVEKYIDQL